MLPILPNQMLLTALSMLQPRRWKGFAITFVLASGFGALLTALVVQAVGPWLSETLLSGGPEEGAAAGVLALVERHGFAGLALLAMLPWPPRVAVIACAVVGLPPVTIGLAVAIGRTAPVVALALTGAKAPYLLRRLKAVDRVMREVEARRFAALDQPRVPVAADYRPSSPKFSRRETL